MDHVPTKKKKAWIWGVGILIPVVLLAVAILWIAGVKSPKVIDIDTPYGTLEYPREYEDGLHLREATENGVYAKTFSAQLGEDRYDLFTLYFGETDQGNLYGRFADEAQTPVYILCYTPPEGHTLTMEQQEQFYAMADGINTVVRSLAANKKFRVS